MKSNPSSQTAKAMGIALVLSASLLGAIVTVTAPFSGCTEVRVNGGEAAGFEFHGLKDGNIVYSPKGVNKCTSPVEVALIPLVGFSVGVGIFRWGQISFE